MAPEVSGIEAVSVALAAPEGSEIEAVSAALAAPEGSGIEAVSAAPAVLGALGIEAASGVLAAATAQLKPPAQATEAEAAELIESATAICPAPEAVETVARSAAAAAEGVTTDQTHAPRAIGAPPARDREAAEAEARVAVAAAAAAADAAGKRRILKSGRHEDHHEIGIGA